MLAALANKYKSIIDQNSFKQSKNMLVNHGDACSYRDDLNMLRKLHLSLPVEEPQFVQLWINKLCLSSVENYFTKKTGSLSS